MMLELPNRELPTRGSAARLIFFIILELSLELSYRLHTTYQIEERIVVSASVRNPQRHNFPNAVLVNLYATVESHARRLIGPGTRYEQNLQ
jgi:hypothetical protein